VGGFSVLQIDKYAPDRRHGTEDTGKGTSDGWLHGSIQNVSNRLPDGIKTLITHVSVGNFGYVPFEGAKGLRLLYC
jgi:hypothetical protein